MGVKCLLNLQAGQTKSLENGFAFTSSSSSGSVLASSLSEMTDYDYSYFPYSNLTCYIILCMSRSLPFSFVLLHKI